jgi:putative Mn2+ efflux pump MntP
MLALLILAFALAMDAFAVSIVRGSARGHHLSEGLKLAFAFGIAQGLMPLIGWGLGLAFAEPFKRVDHWIAFGLLSILGIRLLWEGLFGADEPGSSPNKQNLGLGLLVSAFATSIDAAAAGVTLPLLGVAVPVACLVIAAMTGVICLLGYILGSKVSPVAGKRAEIVGGFVLVGLGIKILVEHLNG